MIFWKSRRIFGWNESIDKWIGLSKFCFVFIMKLDVSANRRNEHRDQQTRSQGKNEHHFYVERRGIYEFELRWCFAHLYCSTFYCKKFFHFMFLRYLRFLNFVHHQRKIFASLELIKIWTIYQIWLKHLVGNEIGQNFCC